MGGGGECVEEVCGGNGALVGGGCEGGERRRAREARAQGREGGVRRRGGQGVWRVYGGCVEDVWRVCGGCVQGACRVCAGCVQGEVVVRGARLLCHRVLRHAHKSHLAPHRLSHRLVPRLVLIAAPPPLPLPLILTLSFALVLVLAALAVLVAQPLAALLLVPGLRRCRALNTRPAPPTLSLPCSARLGRRQPCRRCARGRFPRAWRRRRRRRRCRRRRRHRHWHRGRHSGGRGCRGAQPHPVAHPRGGSGGARAEHAHPAAARAVPPAVRRRRRHGRGGVGVVVGGEVGAVHLGGIDNRINKPYQQTVSALSIPQQTTSAHNT